MNNFLEKAWAKTKANFYTERLPVVCTLIIATLFFLLMLVENGELSTSMFWDGSQLLFAPLLKIFTEQQVVVFYLLLHILLLFIAIITAKDLCMNFSIIITGIMLMWNLNSDVIPITIIFDLAVLLILNINKWNLNFNFVYSMVGILTAFFSGLHFPLITFILPTFLVIYQTKVLIKPIHVIKFFGMWLSAFLLTLASKWILAYRIGLKIDFISVSQSDVVMLWEQLIDGITFWHLAISVVIFFTFFLFGNTRLDYLWTMLTLVFLSIFSIYLLGDSDLLSVKKQLFTLGNIFIFMLRDMLGKNHRIAKLFKIRKSQNGGYQDVY